MEEQHLFDFRICTFQENFSICPLPRIVLQDSSRNFRRGTLQFL